MDLSIYLEAELLILVPVLNLVGYWIKNTGKVKSCYIPLILSVFSILLCAVKTAGSGAYGSVTEYIFASLTKGIIAAAAAVYSNQIYKQSKGESRDDENSDNG